MRKYTRRERIMIALSTNESLFFDCKQHGLFSVRIGQDVKCPYPYGCNNEISLVDNIDSLRRDYRRELGIQ